MKAEDRKELFRRMACAVAPEKHKRAMVVAQFLDIKPQTVRVYMSKSGKAPSMVLISLFSLKLKSPQVR